MIASEWAKENGVRLLERALSAIQNGVVITDATVPDDPIVYVNNAFECITGYASAEVVGRNPRFLQAGDDDQPALEELRAAREARNDGIECAGILRNYRKDGALFYNELSVAPVRDEEGRASNHIGVMSDVTKREQAKERLRFQAQLLDAVGQAVVAVDLRGRVTYWNRSAEGLYGWTAEDVIGRPANEVLVSEDQRGLVGEIWSELSVGRSWSGEFLVRRRDGTSFPAMVTDTPVFDEQGALVGIIGVSSDITGRKEAEEALKENEKRFRQLFEQAVDTLLVHDEGGRIVDCNAEACRSLGYSREEMLALSVKDFAANLSSGEGRASEGGPLWRRAVETRGFGAPAEGVHLAEHRRKDGSTFPVEVRVGHVDYSGERMMLASCRDVTEIKRAAEALHESEERYRCLVELSPEAIAVHDGRELLFVNSAGARFFGATAPGELVGRPVLGFVHPDDREIVASRVREVLEGGEIAPLLEERYLRIDGSVVQVEVAAHPVTYAGKPAVQAVLRDVTERKATEEALRKSEANLAEAQRLARLGSWEWDVMTGESVWSDEAYRVCGFEPQGVAPTFERFFETAHPDDRGLLGEKVEATLREGEPYDLEHRLVLPDGEVRVVHCRGEVAFGEGGEPLRMFGTVHDVTERKEALRESEERFRSLVQNASDVLMVVGADGKVRYVSPAVEKVLGYAPDYVIGRDAFDVVHPEDAARVRGSVVDAAGETGDAFAMELRSGSRTALAGISNRPPPIC